MKTKVIINNYNYARYLPECLDSVLNQTHSFDQVIVVDDGSTDNSREIIESYRDKHPVILPIFKPNGGQLSCFNAAVEYIEEQDAVFLLDADDLFPHDYAEKMLPELDADTDHAFCQPRPFRSGEEEPLANAAINNSPSVAIPSSSYLTRYTGRFIGTPTSANVFTGRLFRQLLPYPFERDWIISADCMLIVGASVLGAKKKFVKSLAIAYRVHGSNLFHGKRNRASIVPQRRLCRERAICYLCDKYYLNRKVTFLQTLLELLALPPAARAENFIPGIFTLSVFHLLPIYVLVMPEPVRVLIGKIKGKGS